MIKIIVGGKRHAEWAGMAIAEYEKRLKKPFDIEWRIMEEEKLNKFLLEHEFSTDEYLIILDERGENISSPEFAEKLEKAFNMNRQVVLVVGGAFGMPREVFERANFVWSFSRLVFPHQLIRVMLTEQIYRAQEISRGGKYHHE